MTSISLIYLSPAHGLVDHKTSERHGLLYGSRCKDEFRCFLVLQKWALVGSITHTC